MKNIKYYAYFEEARDLKYDTVQDVTNSIIRYNKLVNYRLFVTKGNNNYLFICNALDATIFTTDFCKKLMSHIPISADCLIRKLDQFESIIRAKYSTKALIRSTGIIKDTLQLIRLWKVNLLNQSFKDYIDKIQV